MRAEITFRSTTAEGKRRRLVLWVVLLATVAMPVAAQPRARGGGRPGPARMGKANRSPLERFRTLSPEQKRRVMESLPPERKKTIENRLKTYNQLDPKEREKLREQYQVFRQLPAERQETFRHLFRRFNNLAEDRQNITREEYNRLQQMSESERRERINSDEFRNKYTLSEQQLLQDLSKILPPPEAASSPQK